MEPTVTLTPDQVAFYQENGYLSIPELMPADEVERIREIYDRLFAARVGRETGDQFDLAGTDEEGVEAKLPQILGPSRFAPELLEGQYRANLAHVVKQLLGPEGQVGGDHMIFKPARIGAETPWHQDQAYWDPGYDYNSLSVWIPLQEATIENGCMWFVPGSHRLDIHTHHSIGHDPRVHGLEVEGADVSKAVACPLPPGGATFHHCRTLHYTGPNRSDIDRRAYIIGAGVPATKRVVPYDFYWNRVKQTAREARAAAVRGRMEG
ncbi:MAG TPA: phytanoyl-CoA dioxygenase family protein [Fimbriimonadaceae bacterium]|nr:phytanoyl-CoA dioxygenase family protein [Fimbriimonadaceae bacterium]